MPRTGIGIDSHAFAEGRKLILGGVEVPYERGLQGFSDADVLAHAITDALLGAAGLGDIGQHFPDTDEHFKDADSLELLREAVRRATAAIPSSRPTNPTPSPVVNLTLTGAPRASPSAAAIA